VHHVVVAAFAKTGRQDLVFRERPALLCHCSSSVAVVVFRSESRASARYCRNDLDANTPTGRLARSVDLYEYQGKELFGRHGIPVSEGRLATSPEEARAAAEELGGEVVVKAQVLTGGRGKAGGIKLADDPDEAEVRAREILGLDIRGHVVNKLWLEQASEIAKEYYLSLTFDRGEKRAL